MQSLVINPAVAADVFGIARVHIRSWQVAYADILEREFLDTLSVENRAQRWHDILERAETQTFVGSQDGEIVGFVSFGPCRDAEASTNQGEIWALYADPTVWGKGVGRSLLEHAIRELRIVGRSEVSLWVLRQNLRGIKFYQKFGFQPVHGNQQLCELGGRKIEEVCLRLREDTKKIPSLRAAPEPCFMPSAST